jgi:hypothetical protein
MGEVSKAGVGALAQAVNIRTSVANVFFMDESISTRAKYSKLVAEHTGMRP